MSSSELAGLRILIVEDNPIISLDVAETLADAGAIVIGPAHTVTQALKLVDGGGLDAAVLDYRLEQRFHRRLPTGWGASPCLTFSHQFAPGASGGLPPRPHHRDREEFSATTAGGHGGAGEDHRCRSSLRALVCCHSPTLGYCQGRLMACGSLRH